MRNISIYSEDDEMPDEEYFKDDEVIHPEDLPQEEDLSEDDSENSETEDDEESDDATTSLNEDAIEQEYLPNFYTEKSSSKPYKPKGFTNAFLRCECNIKCEANKTVCKFEYQGNTYTGKVLKRVNDQKYVFVVDKVTERNEPKESGLKIISIPDAYFIGTVKK